MDAPKGFLRLANPVYVDCFPVGLIGLVQSYCIPSTMSTTHPQNQPGVQSRGSAKSNHYPELSSPWLISLRWILIMNHRRKQSGLCTISTRSGIFKLEPKPPALYNSGEILFCGSSNRNPHQQCEGKVARFKTVKLAPSRKSSSRRGRFI